MTYFTLRNIGLYITHVSMNLQQLDNKHNTQTHTRTQFLFCVSSFIMLYIIYIVILYNVILYYY